MLQVYMAQNVLLFGMCHSQRLAFIKSFASFHLCIICDMWQITSLRELHRHTILVHMSKFIYCESQHTVNTDIKNSSTQCLHGIPTCGEVLTFFQMDFADLIMAANFNKIQYTFKKAVFIFLGYLDPIQLQNWC